MLVIENLGVNYQEFPAISGVSLQVGDGDLVALIGSNGAGKTTMLNAISGLIRPASGRISWDGKAITGMPPDEICRLGIVQVPEGRKLFARMTVEENLEMGAYHPAARSALRQNMQRMFDLFPRLWERRRQAAGSLSGGEQQMLAVGRALMAQPKLLMLDEPSLGLAPIMAADVFRIVAELNRDGLSILLVSQEVLQALSIARYAYLMENGQAGVCGPAAELLADPRVKESYLGL
jgi:branched-chain amino acid transport system ATP-binding protein